MMMVQSAEKNSEDLSNQEASMLVIKKSINSLRNWTRTEMAESHMLSSERSSNQEAQLDTEIIKSIYTHIYNKIQYDKIIYLFVLNF